MLSDKDKRGAYDRFGGDPESRFGSASAQARSQFAGTRMHPGMGAEIDPEDLFNMFFGGGMGGMGAGFGPTFAFGGPGFRTTTFRTGPGFRTYAAPRQAAQSRNQTSMLFQLLPIFVLVLFSLLSYIPSLFTVPDPDFRWQRTPHFRAQKTTLNRGVSYFIEPASFAKHPFVVSSSSAARRADGNAVRERTSAEFVMFERRVEDAWKRELYRQCDYMRELQRRRALDAQGFFGIGVSAITDQGDKKKVAKIMSEVYDSCEQLEQLFHIRM